MRVLLATLLLALSLVAQDEPQKKPDKAQVMRWFMQLHDEDDARRQQALEELAKLFGSREAVDVVAEFFVPPMRGGLSGGMVVMIDKAGPSEAITGSYSDEHGKVSYTLKKGTGAKYDLAAKRTKDGRLIETIEDSGTLADLRKRHAFLKDFKALSFMPLGRMRADLGLPQRAKALGMFVARPSRDLAHHFYVPPGVGWVVRHVDKDSRADKLGLKPYDLLLKIDGKWIEDLSQLDAEEGVLEYRRRADKGRLILK